MLASRRFQAILGCAASVVALVLADKAYNPQHIVLGKNGQVQDVDPSLYFHERAKKSIASRASVVRNEFQHRQQYQLKADGHAPKAAATRSPKLSISRVPDNEVTVEKQPQSVLQKATSLTSDAKAAPPAQKKEEEVATTKTKSNTSAEKQERQRSLDLAERRAHAQVSLVLARILGCNHEAKSISGSGDLLRKAPMTSSPRCQHPLTSPSVCVPSSCWPPTHYVYANQTLCYRLQAVEVSEVSLQQIESFESALPGVPGSILFAEMVRLSLPASSTL